MNSIAVIGSGNVGRALSTGLDRVGHGVTLGRRDPGAGTPVDGVPALAIDAAIRDAEIVVNAAPGDASVDLFSALADDIAGRILVDVSNASRPGTAAALQRALPRTHVVKTLNTMLFPVMTAPDILGTTPTVFLSGDDSDAKAGVQAILASLGWADDDVIDLGGIDTAVTVEAAYPLAAAVIRANGLKPFALGAVF